MISHLKIFIARIAIEKALKRKAPNTIPLSNLEKMRQRDFFTISLTDALTRDRFHVYSIQSEGLGGYWFSGSGHGYEASVANHTISLFELEITHYAQEIELKYSSPLNFVWSSSTLQAKREVWKYRFRIWRFSKKKLPRQDRIEVLTWAYSWTLQSEHYQPSFSPLSFMIEKYGNFIIFHPEKDKLRRYYKIVFESLVESGGFKVEKAMLSYSLSPKSLYTLDRYEEADRRHIDNVRQQSTLGWLTFALVLTGIGQVVVAWFKSS